jgi:hypothetical protein
LTTLLSNFTFINCGIYLPDASLSINSTILLMSPSNLRLDISSPSATLAQAKDKNINTNASGYG